MKKLLILISIIVFSSCDNPYEDILFVEIKNAEIIKADFSNLEITATCVLFNPNSVGLNLKNADFDVYVNGKKAATIDQNEDVVMPANSDFEFPIKTTINPKELYGDKGKGLLGATLQILGNQKIDVKYEGTIKVGKGAINFNVPVIDSLSVPVKLKF
jgi:LEA14-like dessication related protein